MASALAFPTARISTRISLRWVPDLAFENTDTVVLSVGEWYLDLRIDKVTGTIDWAIAGERIVESHEPVRVLFTHELDSHGEFSASDLGTFSKLRNGDDLETGSMPRADLPGAPVTEYEEVWRELRPLAGPESNGDKAKAWILESVDDGEEEVGHGNGEKQVVKTFIGRIGGTFLALRQEQIQKRDLGDDGGMKANKSGGPVTARREEWGREIDGSGGWRVKYAVGKDSDALPALSVQSASKFEGEGEGAWRKPGSIVSLHGQRYRVRAFEEAS